MESFITFLIYTHAFFGGIGLITGLTIVFIPKGTKKHVFLGKTFSLGMLTGSIISIFICLLPKHENLFLLLIGLFTIYLIIIGNRCIQLKKNRATKTDYLITYIMIGISLIMLILSIWYFIKGVNGYILYFFFGILGLRIAFGDLKLYKHRKLWLRSHVGKMLSALIASITAFIIAGLQINNVYAWLLPSVIGTIYIWYWIKKLKKEQV